MTMTKAHLRAIHTSLDVYYRDPARTARMDRLNAQFVPQGGLAFDIGAHVGDRTGSFLRLGAVVVAVEPQPHIFRALRLLPTITTASTDLIAAARNAATWQGQVWDSRLAVDMTTLDALIAIYGTPHFVKIDVEGHELEVLKGLSLQPAALSFEFTTIQKDVALACLERMSSLGAYEFNVSLGEDHAFVNASWTDAESLKTQIAELPICANSGDVFARLR